MNTVYISNPKYATLIILSILGILGCKTLPEVDTSKLYRKDLEVEIDGSRFHGVYIADKRPQYNLTIETPMKPEMVNIQSCHREIIFKEPGKRVRFSYEPVIGVENIPPCPLEIAAFDKDGENGWATIYFRGDETLAATLGCNGNSNNSRGVSACQSRAGLLQTISFKEAVKAYWPERCSPMKTNDQKHFEWAMNTKLCIYLFTGNEQEHRLVTYGYNKVLIK